MLVLMNDNVTVKTIEASLTIATVNPPMDIDNPNICSGSVTLSVKNPVQGAVYQWYDATGIPPLLATGISFTTPVLTEATGYLVKMKGVPCPPESAAVSVMVSRPPQVQAMEGRRICYGEEITLETIIAEGNISWNVPQTTLRPRKTADYIVTASRPPCTPAYDTVHIIVGDSLYIRPAVLPVAMRNKYYTQQLLTNAETPEFSLLGMLPESLSFDRFSGFINGILSSEKRLEKKYNFTIQVVDIFDCSISQNYSLLTALTAPIVFSPNGDGINEYFMQGYRVIIFDRAGTKIFEGNEGWDGSCNGKAAPNDTYYYILFDTDADGQKIQQAGSITLIR